MKKKAKKKARKGKVRKLSDKTLKRLKGGLSGQTKNELTNECGVCTGCSCTDDKTASKTSRFRF